MNEDINIDSFVAGDEKDVLLLLSEAQLPTGDLSKDKLKHFLVAKMDNGDVLVPSAWSIFEMRGC